ncbi:MAG: hypothetical protein WB696_28635 [Chthoniobacterales bacterium]
MISSADSVRSISARNARLTVSLMRFRASSGREACEIFSARSETERLALRMTARLLTVPLAPIAYFKMQSYRQMCAQRELSIHRLRQQKCDVMTRWSDPYDEADNGFDQPALWRGRHLVK